MKKPRKISVIIPTYNVQEIVKGALQSVDWADEILVVDSYSTDETVYIAKSMGARVLQHEYFYSARQKNWAIPKVKNEWILLLDSDEVVTAKLKKKIEALLSSDEIDNYDGFGIARKHYFFGKFLRWGGRYPLHNVRLFRKTCRYEDRDVHAHIILDKDRMKNISYKEGDLLHFSDRSFAQFFERFDRYSTYQANYMKKVKEQSRKIQWKKFLTNFLYFKAVIKDIWFFIPFSPLLRFLYMYVFRLGFLDGRHGLIIAVLYAMQDYVSKSKYYLMTNRKINIRSWLQEAMMFRTSMLLRAQHLDKHFLKYYHKNLSIVNNFN